MWLSVRPDGKHWYHCFSTKVNVDLYQSISINLTQFLWTILISIDQQSSVLRSMLDHCKNFIAHWSTLIGIGHWPTMSWKNVYSFHVLDSLPLHPVGNGDVPSQGSESVFKSFVTLQSIIEQNQPMLTKLLTSQVACWLVLPNSIPNCNCLAKQSGPDKEWHIVRVCVCVLSDKLRQNGCAYWAVTLYMIWWYGLVVSLGIYFFPGEPPGIWGGGRLGIYAVCVSWLCLCLIAHSYQEIYCNRFIVWQIFYDLL